MLEGFATAKDYPLGYTEAEELDRSQFAVLEIIRELGYDDHILTSHSSNDYAVRYVTLKNHRKFTITAAAYSVEVTRTDVESPALTFEHAGKVYDYLLEQRGKK